MVMGDYSVMSENIQIASFRDCDPPGLRTQSATFLIFRIDDGQYAFAMPKLWMDQIGLPEQEFRGWGIHLLYSMSEFEDFKQVAALVHSRSRTIMILGRCVGTFSCTKGTSTTRYCTTLKAIWASISLAISWKRQHSRFMSKKKMKPPISV